MHDLATYYDTHTRISAAVPPSFVADGELPPSRVAYSDQPLQFSCEATGETEGKRTMSLNPITQILGTSYIHVHVILHW